MNRSLLRSKIIKLKQNLLGQNLDDGQEEEEKILSGSSDCETDHHKTIAAKIDEPSAQIDPEETYITKLVFITVFFLLLVTIVIDIHFELAIILKISRIFPTSSISFICKKILSFRFSTEVDETFLENILIEDILKDEMDSPQISIVDSVHYDENPKRHEKCTHFSCFNIYRCGLIDYHPSHTVAPMKKRDKPERIKVYVYPKYQFIVGDDRIRNPDSLEFKRILSAIITSPYYTNDPREACLFIPNVDTLNFDDVEAKKLPQILRSLPFLDQMNGFNHLMFIMVNSKRNQQNWLYSPSLQNIMIASGVFNDLNYRFNFDVATPIYSIFAQLYETNNLDLLPLDQFIIIKTKRKYTIISTQYDSVKSETRYLLLRLESIYSNRMVLFGFDCKIRSNNHRNRSNPIDLPFISNSSSEAILNLYRQTHVCNNDRRMRKRYLDILHNAEFCLITKNHHHNDPILSDALMSGCIPVIIDDNYVFPFEQRIDWTSISIRIREHSFNSLMDIIDDVSKTRRKTMRINALNIWNLYFRTVENISLTTLDIINERVYPQPKHVHTVIGDHFLDLTPLSFDYFTKGFNYVSPKSSDLLSDGFTAVILTFNRFESLNRVITSVSRVPSCQKVLVIWNNQLDHPPPVDQWALMPLPVQVIKTKQNKLSNRFYPYALIETEAVFAIDDDITMLNPDEIEFAYQTWREFPDRLVGFPSRLHFWNNITHSWYYDSEWKNKISLILTGAAFYHNYYNYLYTFLLPSSVRDWADERMNCEDIAMNFLISNITCKAPIKVTPRKKFKCSSCVKSNYLSADVMHHLQLRSECVDHFANIYRMIPLKEVEFRSNPVLFRDSIPDKFKHYNLIGDL